MSGHALILPVSTLPVSLTAALVCIAGRPAFTAKDRLSAENFFITALDKWREKMGLEKVVLMGHSMGGYLAATYALQHPERVQHLILVCPAGIVSFFYILRSLS